MAEHSNRGGARPNAGRKPLDGKHTVRRALITHDQTAKAVLIGDGNMSAGIREAIDGHSTPVALLTSPDWGGLLEAFVEFGIEGRQLRCQKVAEGWRGQVYEVVRS